MFWRKKRSLDDLAEEIRSHLAIEADQVRGEKGAGADVERLARRAFGNVTSVHEVFYEHGRWLFWDQLSRDVRQALRLVRRQPGFSAVVILTLALGMGATTAIFSLVNAVLLRPLPYRDPGRLAMLWTDDPAHGEHEGRVSLLNYRDWKVQSRTFEDMTVFCGQTFLLGTDGSPERLRSARVPANFLPLVGVEPILGRVFSREEEKRGERVVVLSYGLWQRRFGASAQALGSDVVMDGRKSRIIGVMPSGFRFPFADTQVWEPLTTHPYWAGNQASARNVENWYVLARVRPNTTWAMAQAEMDTIAGRLQKAYPETESSHGIRIVPLPLQTTGKMQLPLLVLFSSVLLMLLIACINVANLLLVRGTTRDREFVVRKALGAGRVRLAGQLLTESLVLAGAGGLLGLLLAYTGLKALVAFGPQDIPRLGEARIDGGVLLFTLGMSVLAAVISGLWPAIQRGTALAGSRQWTTVATRSIRRVLVVGEFALALVLLTGAGLLVRSFLRLQTVDPGFHPENLLTMRIDLHVGKNAAQQVAYFGDAIARVQAIPGIGSAAAIGRFLNSYGPESVAIEGNASALSSGFEAADDTIVGPYFETAGIPVLKGRVFSSQDSRTSTPVAIINQTMAGVYWPNQDPIGKRFRFTERESSPWFTVVGVVGDMHRQGLEKAVAPQVFRPHAQAPDNEMDLLVRTISDPAALASSVRGELQSMDKSVAKFGVTTVEQQLGQQSAERRFNTSLLTLFSSIALLLSAIGIYGLMHYSVVQRQHEIGVRMALGARYSHVVAMVMRQGLGLAATGALVGTVAAWVVARVLSSLLYGITPADPVTFVLAPAILLSAAALASWLPARRATRVDPVLALRQD